MASFFVADGPPLAAGRIRSVERRGTGSGSGRRHRAVVCGRSLSPLLRRPVAGLAQLHHHHARPAHQGHESLASAASAWAWFITSCMGLTAFAVLMPACILLILDHVAGTSFFMPAEPGDQRPTAAALRAAQPCCGSTCSGSSGIPRFTSRSCQAWELCRMCSSPTCASRCSATEC